jgi:hypothetical protein
MLCGLIYNFSPMPGLFASANDLLIRADPLGPRRVRGNVTVTSSFELFTPLFTPARFF